MIITGLKKSLKSGVLIEVRYLYFYFMFLDSEIPVNKKKGKAKKLAYWAIGLGIGYLLILTIMISWIDFMDRKGSGNSFPTLAIVVYYSVIPVLLLLWILSIWSLKLNRSTPGIIALVLSILYLSGLIWFLYALSQICVIC